MDKAATIHPIIRVEGDDAPANHFGDDSINLIRDVLAAGTIVISKRRCAMGLPFRKITLVEIVEVEGGDDNSGS